MYTCYVPVVPVVVTPQYPHLFGYDQRALCSYVLPITLIQYGKLICDTYDATYGEIEGMVYGDNARVLIPALSLYASEEDAWDMFQYVARQRQSA